MKTENNKSEEKKEEQQGSKQSSNANAGFDFSSLLNDKNLVEVLKHLLSGGGAMAGNYFLWIKPLQDKVEALNKTIEKQEKRIKELEEEQGKNADDLFHEQNRQRYESIKGMGGVNTDYFNLNKNRSHTGEFRKTRRAHL